MPHSDEEIVASFTSFTHSESKSQILREEFDSLYQVAHTNQYPEGDQGQVLPQSRDIQPLQHEIIETPRGIS
jgi:hypothetical protein